VCVLEAFLCEKFLQEVLEAFLCEKFLQEGPPPPPLSQILIRFLERWEPKKERAPEEAKRVVEEELAKLGGLEPVSTSKVKV
jgi:hypothetical protein